MSAEELDPETISKELRLTSTHSFKKGDKFETGRRMIVRPWGVWQLSSEGKVRSTNPERHAKYILKKLEPNSHALQKYLNADEYFIDIYFWWQTAGEGGGFALSSPTIKRLSALCNFMSFTFVK
jgi:hypothetical protein